MQTATKSQNERGGARRSRRPFQWLGAGLLILISAAPALWGQTGETVVVDEIVAKVNQEIITLTDLQKELSAFHTQLSLELRDPAQAEKEFQVRKRMLLKTLINTKLMIQKAEDLGMTANIDAEVAANLEETRKQAGITNMDEFDRLLRQNGSSLAERKEWLKRDMIVDMVIGQFVYSKLTLMTPEIEAYYKENRERFSDPAEVELAEILFLTEGKDKAAVRQKAEQALARVRGGVPFEEEAKKSSEGPTAARGGLIGSFKKGSMAPSLEEVAFTLKPGEISGIIETEYGYQIVKLVGKKESQPRPLDEVRPIIQRELYMKKAEPEIKEFLEELRSQSYVYIAPQYRDQYDLEGLL
jgi:parvulin-like peptidyl-prolyl isomerase